MVIAFLFFRRLVEVSPEMVELEKQKKKVYYCGTAFTAALLNQKRNLSTSGSFKSFEKNKLSAENEGRKKRVRVVRAASNVTKISGYGVNYKLWLEGNGATFGDGLFHILMNIETTGSISQAARQMNMSYRAAWGKIKFAEERWGVPLLITQVGGEMGGGARLTPVARELIDKFRRLREVVDSFINYSFQDIFRGWPTL
jgi:molybdate transport system regulatory protein